MNARTQRLCVWCGPVMMVALGIGLLFVAGLIPPPSPEDSAQEVARMYVEDQTRIRIGLIIVILGAGLLIPWSVVIALQLRRIEGRWSPMALTQLGAGVTTPLPVIMPMMVMAAATYRPRERSPEVTQALHDIAWLTFIGVVGLVAIQVFAVAIAILSDHREQPVFPRWLGYFNAWCGLLSLPGGLVIAFRDGPFAWNGVFAFWIPLVVFGLWLAVMTVFLLRAITRHAAEHEESVTGGRPAAAAAAPA